MKKNNFKLQILFPLTTALGILLIAFVYNVYHTQQSIFVYDVERRLIEVQELFEKQLVSETELLHSIIEILQVNPGLQEAWKARDREALYDLSVPLLTKLEAKYRITHFYFHNADRTNFLRVYDPERYGDTVNRLTLLKAEKSGIDTAGLELGKLGTLTLRAVHPWRIDGQVVGYIELGEEIHHLYQKLHDILNIDLFFSIYKEYIDQQSWETGMQLFNIPHNWNLLESAVIINRTMPTIPKEFGKYLVKGQHVYMQMATDLEVSVEGKQYRVGVVPLFDISDREVGDIVILYNVTNQLKALNRTIIISILLSFAVGLALFLFFAKYLGKLEQQLFEYQNHLEDKVKERTSDLTNALEEIKTLKGILPICSYCKKIRDDKGFWSQVESYFQKHTDAEFSHGVCPDCYKMHFPDHDDNST